MDCRAPLDPLPPRQACGFSLIELMISMTITMAIGLIVFQLFLQNEQVFRDQNLILEMQQSARAVASMISDEIRMAGQGVPAFAASMDATTQEEAQTILNGSDSSTVVFRAGISNATASVQDAPPLSYTVGTPTTITVDDVTAIDDLIGNNTDRFVYLWGATGNTWTWVRAQVTAINTGTNVISVTPRQRATAGDSFSSEPMLVAEEGVAYRLNGSDLQRGTTRDFTTATAPVVSYSAVGENFTGLTFSYFDGSGNAVTPNSLANRALIRQVDFTLSAATAEALAATGEVRTFAISMTVYPRNISFY